MAHYECRACGEAFGISPEHCPACRAERVAAQVRACQVPSAVNTVPADPEPDLPELATAAAHAAADALADLLRFRRHGAALEGFAFEADVTLFLADALRKTIAIELFYPQCDHDKEALQQLDHACFAFEMDFGK
ncbi:MAG: hypothetical protein RIS94_3599 [Pseudomonadota bacterium]|jgi:hypothetical protein